MKEQDIQAKILKYLKAKGAFVFKTLSCNVNGIPDIVGIYKSAPIYIEVKGPRGRLSPIQKEQLDRINKAGGHGIVARSVDDVKALFNCIDNPEHNDWELPW